MGAKLRALLDLQEIELQIVDIRRQLARRERRVEAQQRKMHSARQQIETLRNEIQHDQATFDSLDVEIKSRSAHIEKLRQHLNTVRTNKEYASVLAQINTEKADLTRLEGRALEMMQQIEQKKQSLAEHEQAQQAEHEKLERLQQELEQTRASFAGRLEALQQQRDQAAARLDVRTLELFDRLSQRYDGEALAAVADTGGEFICEGCHMTVRAEVPNALKIRDEIMTCKNCGRILYLPDGQ